MTNNEKKVEWALKHQSEIEKAVYYARNDRGEQLETVGHGSGISKPTEQQGIYNATELYEVIVLTDEGESRRLKWPERWLEVTKTIRSRYEGQLQGEIISLKYDNKEKSDKIIEKLKVSRPWFYAINSTILTYGEGVAQGKGLLPKLVS